MKNEITVRNALQALEQESRRSFLRTGFSKVAGAAGLVAAFDRFGPQLFGADVDEAESRDAVETRIPYLVYSALGNIIIPVDEDPGWATFEPGISLYGLDVFVRQVLLGGSYPAFAGYLSCLSGWFHLLQRRGRRFADGRI